MKLSCLEELYKNYYGALPESISRIPGAGSNREYYRINGFGMSVIGVIGTDIRENKAFIEFSRTFSSGGHNVPRVMTHTEDMCCYLQEDLGDVSLFSLIGKVDVEPMASKCVRALARLQQEPGVDYSYSYPVSKFDKRSVIWDLNYFKYCFLKPSGVEFAEAELENDFENFAAKLLSYPQSLGGFMYRDCQSRNVMIKDDEPYWIDYQGGRFGPGVYDIVSFLWQAKADFSECFRCKMIEEYIDEYTLHRHSASAQEIRKWINPFVLFRLLQVLGAYGFRGLVEHKAHFVESIPYALKSLRKELARGAADAYPELKKALLTLVNLPKFELDKNNDKLTVSVFSFSYKKGYPEDLTGNGGGFMFDCRAMHNPGRYEEYKQLTGRDKSVIDFLESRGEVKDFLASVWVLTDSAIARYVQRGFRSLQIGFGCTGGQHRSVYCAEQTAHHIATRYSGVGVKLIHREQGITEIIEGEAK